LLGRTFEPRSDPIPLDIYIACLSESCDDLAMWYMYADNGKGVCLGFDGQYLCKSHQAMYSNWREPFFGSVTYDVRKLKRGIYNFIVSIEQYLNDHFAKGKNTQELEEGEFFSITMYYIAAAILCFKHPKFCHEREWRLFCPVPTEKITNIGFGISENGAIRRMSSYRTTTQTCSKTSGWVQGTLMIRKLQEFTIRERWDAQYL
jgi:Protein of unknown function (DUF2971)